MTVRKALLLTYHFPPSAASGSHRLLGFTRHLPSFDWQLVVIAPTKLPWEPSDPVLAADIPPDTIVYRVDHELRGLRALPLRLFAFYASWLPRAWPRCVRAVGEHAPDAVITSGPPHLVHLLGLLLKRRFGLTWLADFRDPWITGTPEETAQSLSSRWYGWLESRVMAGADAIIANAPNAATVFRRAYPRRADRIIAITNGYDPDRFPSRTNSPREHLLVVHPGQIYAGRDPRPFLDAISELVARGRHLRVEFIGHSREHSHAVDLAAEIAARKLESIVAARGFVPYGESLASMVDADILLLLDSPGRIVGVPAKLYEYIGAQRPILALCEPAGDAAWVMHESGLLHRIARPDDSREIAGALGQLLDACADNVGAPANFPARFTRREASSSLATVLNSLAETGRPANVSDERRIGWIARDRQTKRGTSG